MAWQDIVGSPWFGVAITIIIAVSAAKIISSLVKWGVRSAARRKDLDPKLLPLARAEWLVMALIVLAGVHLSLPMLGFATTSLVVRILETIEILFVVFLVIAVVDIVIELYLAPYVQGTESKLDDQILYWAHKVSHAVLVILGVLYVLVVWGVDPVPLLGSLGIAGLAVALALRPTLENIFSGISLIVDKTFQLGDIIKLDDGDLGVVHKIGLRTTRIRTFDNEIIIIPNSVLANSKLENINQPDPSIRTSVEFGVEYGTDPEYVKKIVLEECEAIEARDKERDVMIMFKSMGDSAITFKVMIWCDDLSKKWPVNQEAITRIYRRLYKEGIGIPFPQTTVWLRDDGKAKDISPQDKRFKSTNKKYFSDWGREYKPGDDTDPKVLKQEKSRAKKKKK